MYSLNKNGEKSLGFSKNLKQIGGIENRFRIYVEDYVHTYLQNYAKADGVSEKIAVLVGEYREMEDSTALFISGAVQGKFSKSERGMEVFTDETWDYVNEQMNVYFNEKEIVGWVHTQPDYGTFLIPGNESYHKDHFTNRYHVFYVLDILEKTDCFYIYDEHYNLTEAAGYFVYYDRNEKMHEYMLDNNFAGIKTNLDKEFDLQKAFDSIPEPDKDVELVAVSRRKFRERKAYNQNRVINMMAALSGVLFLICFLMGAGLIQNGDRISKLEEEIMDLNQTYKTIVSQIRNGNVTPVFAGTDLPETGETPEASQAVVIVENDPLHSVSGETDNQPTNGTGTAPADTGTDLDNLKDKNDAPLKEKENTEEESYDFDLVPESYVVQAGDNLSFISIKFYGSRDKMQEIMDLNNMSDPNKLIAGKKIKLPRP